MHRSVARRDFLSRIAAATISATAFPACIFVDAAASVADENKSAAAWKAGVARTVITPETSVWLAGYGTKRAPDGKLHDWWRMARALEAGDDRRKQTATDRIRPEIVAPESAWTLAFAAT